MAVVNRGRRRTDLHDRTAGFRVLSYEVKIRRQAVSVSLDIAVIPLTGALVCRADDPLCRFDHFQAFKGGLSLSVDILMDGRSAMADAFMTLAIR